jgi:hypothetical protein
MLPDAEKKVSPYVLEERKSLVKIIKSIKNINEFNFVVIGSGTLWYIDLVYSVVKKYIAIETLADIFIAKQVMFVLRRLRNIDVINKDFGKFPKSLLGNANSIFIFHFNILSYIFDPVKKSINILKWEIFYIYHPGAKPMKLIKYEKRISIS